MNLSDLNPGKFVAVDLASTPMNCDLNDDGDDNGRDVQLFVGVLLGNTEPNWQTVCAGDVENTPDATIDFDDVTNFVTCLLNKP